MTTRIQKRMVVHSLAMALLLPALANFATAQIPGQAADTQTVSTTPWLTPVKTTAAQTPPALMPAQPTNSASLLAGSTDDPNWIDAPVKPASFTTQTFYDTPPQKDGFKLGALTVKPYGILWTDMIYSSSRTFPGHFVLWIDSEETQGENTIVLDARRSRVGVDILGPEVDVFGGMKGGGKIEVDFFGSFTTENTTNVRLRHVYWEAKNDDLRLLAGQTWDLVSPLYPNTVNFSVNWAAGNIGFRRTQFRAERYIHLSDDVTLAVQGAVAQNIIPDLATGDLAAGVVRETGNWPMLQARTGITFPAFDCKPWTIGFSGHIGETGFDFLQTSPGPLRMPPQDDARFLEWSVNTDINMPITDRLGFHGEMFHGSNLSNVLGGIGQGVCPCNREPIMATGGWGEIWYDWNSCLTSHFGFGVDDPNNNDSLIGRTYNRVLYANVFVQITDNLRTGFEVSSWLTTYHNDTLNEPDPNDRIAFPTLPGEATVLDWTVQYRF